MVKRSDAMAHIDHYCWTHVLPHFNTHCLNTCFWIISESMGCANKVSVSRGSFVSCVYIFHNTEQFCPSFMKPNIYIYIYMHQWYQCVNACSIKSWGHKLGIDMKLEWQQCCRIFWWISARSHNFKNLSCSVEMLWDLAITYLIKMIEVLEKKI